MNGIMSWVSSMISMSSMDLKDDEDCITIQDMLLLATFSSIFALSYVLQGYRKSERLNKAKISDLTIKNNKLNRKYNNQVKKNKEIERSFEEEEKKIRDILVKVLFVKIHQHSNLSK